LITETLIAEHRSQNRTAGWDEVTKMRLTILTAVGCGLALALVPARAEKIDLSTMTCKQFMGMSKDEIGIILTWLDAYYKDEDDPPVLDTDKFVRNAGKLGAYCATNPTIGLITATDKLFGE
jgi:acid stress chaperone HdeB